MPHELLHDLGDTSQHGTATLAELNALISDGGIGQGTPDQNSISEMADAVNGSILTTTESTVHAEVNARWGTNFTATAKGYIDTVSKEIVSQDDGGVQEIELTGNTNALSGDFHFITSRDLGSATMGGSFSFRAVPDGMKVWSQTVSSTPSTLLIRTNSIEPMSVWFSDVDTDPVISATRVKARRSGVVHVGPNHYRIRSRSFSGSSFPYFTVPANDIVEIDARIIMRFGAEFASFRLNATFENVGGVATQVGPTTWIYANRTTAGTPATGPTFAIDGANIYLSAAIGSDGATCIADYYTMRLI